MRALLTTLATLSLSLASAQAVDPQLGSEEQRKQGEALYLKYCAQCHGDQGDGLGVAAPYLKPRPRDFTKGKYKIRTTPNGTLPSDEDLKRVIRLGMPYSGMPPWPQLSDDQITNLVYHIKTFYSGFGNADELAEPLPMPGAPSFSEESAQRGKEVYDQIGCARCHGDTGRGNGTSAPTLADDWGYHLRPANLAMPWTFRGGATREDVYRTLMTGFNGTPMPSFADEAALPVEDRWPLVDYIYSLSQGPEPRYSELVIAVPADRPVDLAEGLALFENAPQARFPVIGQIIQPGRNFYPAVSALEARAVYDGSRIAFLVQWDDMTAETAGNNGPDMKAPEFDPLSEDELERIKKDPPAVTGGDPFAAETQADPFAADTGAAAAGDTTRPPSPYSDAVALQFPAQAPSGTVKPYFLFGDSANPVELWFVDLARQAVQGYRARGSDAIEPSQTEPVDSWSQYENGRWSVIFVRKRTSGTSVSFQPDQFMPIAFSIWDGFNQERGNKRTLSNWYTVYLEPRDKPSPFGPMARNALIVFGVLVLTVIFIRKRHSLSTAGARKEEDR